jgi:hypothetical protein
MEEQLTCGKGLAEHSVLPGRIGEVIGGLAENLELHTRALDVSEDAGRAEHEAYAGLAGRYRRIAEELRSASEEMAGYRDLPPAPHDLESMRSPELGEAFTRFLEAERELVAALEEAIARDEALLAGD